VFVSTKSGDTYCWGKNDSGQLGLGDYTARKLPEKVILPCHFEEISCGGSFTFGISDSRDIWIAGQLSSNSFQKSEFSQVVAAAAGLKHMLILNSEGKIYGWGDNWACQLGMNTFGLPSKSVRILLEGEERERRQRREEREEVVGVYCGADSSMALCKSGSLFLWGMVRLPCILGGKKDCFPTHLPGFHFFLPNNADELWCEIFLWIYLGRQEEDSLFWRLPAEVNFAFVQLFFQ
jgi:alpha-tubulin suppressor-like RCC1 family protein